MQLIFELVNYWDGFLCPDPAGSAGSLYIDKIYALRPAGMPEIETLLLYGFNEKNADNDAPKGWTNAKGQEPVFGTTEATPTEGTGYMEMFLGDAWIQNVETAGQRVFFDNLRVSVVKKTVVKDWCLF